MINQKKKNYSNMINQKKKNYSNMLNQNEKNYSNMINQNEKNRPNQINVKTPLRKRKIYAGNSAKFNKLRKYWSEKRKKQTICRVVLSETECTMVW